MANEPFTLLFDAQYPFRRAEVRWLQRRDRRGLLRAEDISTPGYDPGRHRLTEERIHARLHGVHADGTVAEGLPAIREARRAADLGWVMAPTDWPLLRHLFDLGHVVFARWRVPLGSLFAAAAATTPARCAESASAGPPPAPLQ